MKAFQILDKEKLRISLVRLEPGGWLNNEVC